jgi:hypothetical protein
MTTPDPTTPADELVALRLIVAILDKLGRDAQMRNVAWLWEAYFGTPHVVEPRSEP